VGWTGAGRWGKKNIRESVEFYGEKIGVHQGNVKERKKTANALSPLMEG